ncbi:hypothetical protein C8A00DRAFT_31082 [Chaetomidium leptoderma]|uniref:Uncharacterized protein n=1 Tax=Chaetomidium leptoderma TaxID=669021 RepID=A0AAN6VQN3_9PEZI|nr:hypothetical protein C8A00DRAFT_31082 [Chaetomidium leptoderma]
MYWCYDQQHHASSARHRRKGFLRTVRKGICKTFHDHPERIASSASLVHRDNSQGKWYPKDVRIGSVSDIQLPTMSWADQNASTAGTSTYHPAKHFIHYHRTTSLQANLGGAALLELSDSVRESLAKHGICGLDADRLSLFLQLAVFEEAGGAPTLDFETIKAARLDKLVADLTTCGEMASSLPSRFVHDVVSAEKLERMWRARFKVDYVMIDEIRANELATRWRLRHGPHVPPRCTMAPSTLMLSVPGPYVEPKGDISYKPGGWWLDMTCARLYGVVGAEPETTSKGDDKTPTLPLLTGREINAGHNRVRYLREGSLADMHPALQTGKHVRVLRGHLLRSHFAPAAGIRNDGLWKVLKYSERLNEATGRYRLEVGLEKAPGQLSMSELGKVPRPSHLDDWDLYKRLEAGKPDHAAAASLDRKTLIQDGRLGKKHSRLASQHQPDHNPTATTRTLKSALRSKTPSQASGDQTDSDAGGEKRQKKAVIDTTKNKWYLLKK